MSVAIIPMAHDFGWSPTTSGLVQSAFFAGYALTQVPGGYQAAKRGGAVILPLGVALWSAATAAVPLAAGTGALPLLLLCRAAVGAGEGLAPSSATDMIARATPPSERARTVSFVFGGLHAGSLVGLLAAPPLIDAFGWRAVFYGFGGVGLLWCAWWREGGRREGAGAGPSSARSGGKAGEPQPNPLPPPPKWRPPPAGSRAGRPPPPPPLWPTRAAHSRIAAFSAVSAATCSCRLRTWLTMVLFWVGGVDNG